MNVVVRPYMRGNRGLTLLELFVVFLIMSILVGMVLSAGVTGVANNRFAASIAGVAGAIRTARSLAITSGEIHNVRFIVGKEPRVGVYKVFEAGVYLLRDENGNPAGSCTQTGPFDPDWFDGDDDFSILARQTTVYEISGVRLESGTSFVIPDDPDHPQVLRDHLLYDLVDNPETLNLFFYPDGSSSVDGLTSIGIRNQGNNMGIVEVFGVTGEITERR